MHVIIEQANSVIDQRFERRQAKANRVLVDLQLLAQLIRSMRMEADAEDKGGLSVLDTPSILACHHGLQPLFRAVRSFAPRLSRFLSEHGPGLSAKDRDEIKDFISWVRAAERRLAKLRDERLNQLESDLDRLGQESRDEASVDWDVTIADGLDNEPSAS
jgi:hypothetical protein